MGQASYSPIWLHVRFEQGRGKGGVPKTFVPWLMEGERTWELSTAIRMAVAMMRAQCADRNLAHGRDLMPGVDEDYQLHNIDGGLIGKVEDIKWELENGVKRYAELVLTWKNPAELLIRELAITND